MGRQKNTLELFNRYLPADMRDVIDLKKLELCESKHISDGFRTLYNDVLYKCPAIEGQTAYLYAIIFLIQL